ncbi:MAG: general secretion pathway protein A [Saprospiraceae bacterium]|jgi:general secretion pathway protein A
MYQSYFNLSKKPFGIVPDTQFLYQSRSHQEAIANLAYAIDDQNGFVQLTGEVGLGKTMVCRYLLSKLPEKIDVALVLNPKIDEVGLLKNLCGELNIKHLKEDDARVLTEKISKKLLHTHSQDRHTLLIVEEAQNLPKATLEQVRLLTNLETDNQKLLRIILIGQPELAQLLSHYDMRQVAQRITSRYHFSALTQTETKGYIKHRLSVAGSTQPLFTSGALKKIHKLTQGTPRLINLLCDRALIGAYSLGVAQVDIKIVNQAAKEALPLLPNTPSRSATVLWLLFVLALLISGVSLRDRWLPTVSVSNNQSVDVSATASLESNGGAADQSSTPATPEPQPNILAVNPSSKAQIEQQTDSDFRLGIPGKEPQE